MWNISDFVICDRSIATTLQLPFSFFPAHSNKKEKLWGLPFISIDLGIHGSSGWNGCEETHRKLHLEKRKSGYLFVWEVLMVSGWSDLVMTHSLFVSLAIFQVLLCFSDSDLFYSLFSSKCVHSLLSLGGGISDGTRLSLLSPVWEISTWNSRIPLGQCRKCDRSDYVGIYLRIYLHSYSQPPALRQRLVKVCLCWCNWEGGH